MQVEVRCSLTKYYDTRELATLYPLPLCGLRSTRLADCAGFVSKFHFAVDGFSRRSSLSEAEVTSACQIGTGNSCSATDRKCVEMAWLRMRGGGGCCKWSTG